MQTSIVEPIVQLLGIGVTVSGSSTLTVESNFTANAVRGLVGSSLLTAETNLTANAVVFHLVSLAPLTSESNLTASIVRNLSTNLTSQSELVTTASLIMSVGSNILLGESTLTATMFEPLNILVLPTVEYQYSKNRLMQFYGIDSGQSLIITGTTGTIVEYQTGTEIEEADYYFGGGRRHVLDDAEVSAVINAGFGELITIEGVPSGV